MKFLTILIGTLVLTQHLCANELPEPSYAKNIYYISGKYVINVQPYREYEKLRILDLPDMDFYRDPDLKFKIGEVNGDGIVLNDKSVCRHDRKDKYLLKKMELANTHKSGKPFTIRGCYNDIDNDEMPLQPDFLENRITESLEILDKLSSSIEFPDGYYTVNLFATEIKDNVAKIESKKHGVFYFDLKVLEKFRMKIIPPLEEYLKQHPLGAELSKIVGNIQAYPKEKILGYKETHYIDFSKSKMFDASKETICFEEIIESIDETPYRWCYHDGYIYTQKLGWKKETLDVEETKNAKVYYTTHGYIKTQKN